MFVRVRMVEETLEPKYINPKCPCDVLETFLRETFVAELKKFRLSEEKKIKAEISETNHTIHEYKYIEDDPEQEVDFDIEAGTLVTAGIEGPSANCVHSKTKAC